MQLPLHIVAFDYPQVLAVAGLFAPEHYRLARDGYLQTHRQWPVDQAGLMSKQGVEVSSEVAWVQHPYEESLNFIIAMPLALIIKDAHEESAFKRVFFTPLDWQLLRGCPVPVHFVTTALNARPRNVLAGLAVRHSVPPQRRHFLEGAPVPSSCEFVSEYRTDAVVMGTVQHKGLSTLLGTTAEQRLHRAPCSVLAIKPGRLLQS